MAAIVSLGILDYIMISGMLLISLGTGIVFRFTGNRQKTAHEYLMAEKSSTMLPVIMSISVSLTSGVLMVGVPAEVYLYGSQYTMIGFAIGIGMFISTYIFLPVYFQCNVTSIYEFLEMRFGKLTKYTVSTLFIFQMILYMSSVLYSAVLALTAVTDVSTEVIITVCGLTCTFYCFLGGLKAVLWSDVFQGILMFIYVIIVYAYGITEAGGVVEVIKRSEAGDRINFFEALRWSIIPVVLLYVSCSLFGLVLYAVFYMCDPLQAESGLTKHDQIVPYFIVTRMYGIPGFIGLSFAGVFSGSLSTISSALNSLSTVTVIDFLTPLCPFYLNDTKMMAVAKGLSLFYVILCIGICFLISKFQSVVQISLTFLSVVEGPTTAIFCIGVLTRKATDKIIMFALISGFLFASWLGVGSIFSGYRQEALPLESAGCANFTNTTDFFKNSTMECSGTSPCSLPQTEDSSNPAFIIYRMSFLWIPLLSFLFTVSVAFATVLITGWNKNVVPSDSKCLAPIARYFMKGPSEKETFELK